MYRTVDGISLSGEIDLPSGEGPFPVILYVHSWSGTKSQLRAYSQRLAAHGIAGVRIDYRKFSEGTGFPEARADLDAAMEFVRQNADRYGFDTDRFGLCGASAGAVLSALVAQETPDCDLYVALNGGFDLVNRGSGSFPSETNLTSMFGSVDSGFLEDFSAIHRLRLNPPDTLLLHGSNDTVIDAEQAVRFAEAITAAGGYAQVVLFEGEGHGFFNSNRPRFEEVYATFEDFVLDRFGGNPTRSR